jgi:ketosteroid isomerase-like protein
MARGIALADIHPAVEAGVNNQDLDALMALYEPDASMVVLDGSTATGTEAIRDEGPDDAAEPLRHRGGRPGHPQQ